MSEYDDFKAALSSLHEATLDETLWPVASKRIDEACGALGNTLVMAHGWAVSKTTLPS